MELGIFYKIPTGRNKLQFGINLGWAAGIIFFNYFELQNTGISLFPRGSERELPRCWLPLPLPPLGQRGITNELHN